jgi:hypothetical protein
VRGYFFRLSSFLNNFSLRERAMDLFRCAPNAEMYFSSRKDQVWAFLAEDPFY